MKDSALSTVVVTEQGRWRRSQPKVLSARQGYASILILSALSARLTDSIRLAEVEWPFRGGVS